MNVVLDLMMRRANPGRTERTGETHVLYCFWEQNGNKYKTTIGCNKHNHYGRLHSLVERANSSALDKGAATVEVKCSPDVMFPEEFK